MRAQWLFGNFFCLLLFSFYLRHGIFRFFSYLVGAKGDHLCDYVCVCVCGLFMSLDRRKIEFFRRKGMKHIAGQCSFANTAGFAKITAVEKYC